MYKYAAKVKDVRAHLDLGDNSAIGGDPRRRETATTTVGLFWFQGSHVGIVLRYRERGKERFNGQGRELVAMKHC